MSRGSSRFTEPIAFPYPGLRPFQPHEWPVFFGRREHVADMLTVLEDHRFLAVVGPSGGGKSSLVLAGLLPALERGELLTEQSDDWRFVTMRPGDSPFRSLATALHRHLPPVDAAPCEGPRTPTAPFHDGDAKLTEMVLRASPRGFLETLRDASVPDRANVLLLVDQFEEIFRFRVPEHLETPGQAADRRNDAAEFVRLLLATFRQRERPVYVMLTMRSDYLGECDVFDELPQAINSGQYLTPRLNARQLAQAIIEPPRLAQFDGAVQPEVVQRILNDIGTARDELPVVQHALYCAWKHAVARHASARPDASGVAAAPADLVLTLDDYQSTGGLREALSREADQALAECREQGLERIVERVFRGLVQRGASRQHVRRPATVQQLADEAHASCEQVSAVVDVFRRADRSFLMPPVAAVKTLDSTTKIDISHESLIRQWRTLRDTWLPAEDVAEDRYRRLLTAESLYRRHEGDLLQEIELKRLREWWRVEDPNPAWARRYGSAARVDDQAAGDADANLGEPFDRARAYLDRSWQAYEERERDKQREIRNRQTRRLAAVVGAALLLVIAVVWYSERAAQRSDTVLTLVYAAMNAPADSLPKALDRLEPHGSSARPVLERMLKPEDSPGGGDDLVETQKLHVLCALARLGDVRVDDLVRQINIMPVHPRGECRNIVTALSGSREQAVRALAQQFAEEAKRSPPNWQHQARLSLVALSLGDMSLARGMCRLSADPVQRMAFIDTFPSWHGRLVELVDIVDQLDAKGDSAILSAVCLGIGSSDREQMPSDDVNTCRTRLAGWFQSHSSGAVHGAAGWALREWKLTPPEIQPFAPSAEHERPIKDHPWYVNSLGMTMVGIPRGVYRIGSERDDDNKPRDENIEGFWLSDCEVTVGQFRTLVPQATGPQTESDSLTPSDLRKPVINVTWYDAVDFCNRLSEKEGLRPYYKLEIAEREEESGSITEASVAPGKGNGYRLPKEVEWECACRASTRTEYSFGDNDSDLPNYAWFVNNSGGVPHPVAEKRPNAWGLYDTHGNVWEWCEDWNSVGVGRVFRGGSWDFPAGFCRSAYRFGVEPAYRSEGLGFRVGRSPSGQ